MACKHKYRLNDSNFCSVANFYCTLEQETNCKRKEEPQKAKMTNYDRIKAMSVEEMANLLCGCSDCGNGRCYGNDLCTQGDGACNGVVKWLESEVDTE